MISLQKLDLYQQEISKLKLFEGEMLHKIKEFYKIALTYSSNALEGNSLTENETKILIQDGLSVGGKQLCEIYEAVDHAKAYEYIFSLIHNRKITEYQIKYLHKLFYYNIDSRYAGVYRNIDVIITGSKHSVAPYQNLKAEMDKLCKFINEERDNYHPVEFAATLHKKFIYIHPFKDGNGRVARLIMNASLIQDGYLPLIIPLILRQEYIDCLEKAYNDDSSFIEFIKDREIESQKDILRLFHIQLPKLSENKDNLQKEIYNK